jgi:hypothetical protein
MAVDEAQKAGFSQNKKPISLKTKTRFLGETRFLGCFKG